MINQNYYRIIIIGMRDDYGVINTELK